VGSLHVSRAFITSGNFPDPEYYMHEYYKYKQAHPSTTRTANWQLIGPEIKPEGVALAGLEGLIRLL
jgi:hypothetical protein